jgi:hypothetical protein
MTFYCVEKAKGRNCGAKETLGIPQCHYCYEYQRGYVEPSSPLPVKLTMRDEYGNPHSATRWMDNFDGFWTDEHGARGFSL